MSDTISVNIPTDTLVTPVAEWLAEQSDIAQAVFLTKFVRRLDASCAGEIWRANRQLVCMFAEMHPATRQRIKEAIA